MLVVSSIGIPASAGVTLSCTVTCNADLLFGEYNFVNWPVSNYDVACGAVVYKPCSNWCGKENQSGVVIELTDLKCSEILRLLATVNKLKQTKTAILKC